MLSGSLTTEYYYRYVPRVIINSFTSYSLFVCFFNFFTILPITNLQFLVSFSCPMTKIQR